MKMPVKERHPRTWKDSCEFLLPIRIIWAILAIEQTLGSKSAMQITDGNSQHLKSSQDACIATEIRTAARWAPADAPPTANRPGSRLNSFVFSDESGHWCQSGGHDTGY